jgi:hypothetical protein
MVTRVVEKGGSVLAETVVRAKGRSFGATMSRNRSNCVRAGLLQRAALVALLLDPLLPPAAQAADPELDIRSPANVEAKRAALVQYIWGTAWAEVLARLPTSYLPGLQYAGPLRRGLDHDSLFGAGP